MLKPTKAEQSVNHLVRTHHYLHREGPMKNILTLFVFFLCATVGAAFSADEFLVYSAAKTASPPVIDGKLTEPCWKNAEQTLPFVAIGGEAVPIATRTMVCWDSKNLYVAFICQEPMMKEIKKRIAEGLEDPWNESIEMFFDTTYSHFDYIQLRVGVTGAQDARRKYELDEDLNRKWKSAISLGNDAWTVEAAIPFTMLSAKPPSTTETIWGVNFNRARSISPDVPGSLCWSDTKGGFHSPDRFGNLIFFPYQVWLTSFFRERFMEVDRETASLRKTYRWLPKTEQMDSLYSKETAFFADVSKAGTLSGEQAAKLFTQGKELIAEAEEMREAVYLDIISGRFGAGKNTSTHENKTN